MTRRLLSFCGIALFVLVAVMWTQLLPANAQSPQQFPKVRTSSGILVEEVKVGGSCVVVVSEATPSGAVTAIPCSR